VAIAAGLVAFISLWWRARRLRGQMGNGRGMHFVVIRR